MEAGDPAASDSASSRTRTVHRERRSPPPPRSEEVLPGLRAGFDPAEPGSSETLWQAATSDLTSPKWARSEPGRVVVVAPHPDDETLGAGGLLFDLDRRGWSVTVVAVTDGEAAHGPTHARYLQRVRPDEQTRAVSCLSAGAEIIRLAIPDGRVREWQASLENALDAIVHMRDATLLLSTWRGDRHPDHEATGRAAARVAEHAGVAFCEFPIWARHWARPDQLPVAQLCGWHVSRAGLDAKRRAIEAFASQTVVVDDVSILPAHVLMRFLHPIEVLIE
jgi:LmbE family N-acetylglucosaminyl deacetylase